MLLKSKLSSSHFHIFPYNLPHKQKPPRPLLGMCVLCFPNCFILGEGIFRFSQRENLKNHQVLSSAIIFVDGYHLPSFRRSSLIKTDLSHYSTSWPLFLWEKKQKLFSKSLFDFHLQKYFLISILELRWS